MRDSGEVWFTLFRSEMMRIMFLLCFCILFIPSHNASMNAPAPIIHYDCNMIEIGRFLFIQVVSISCHLPILIRMVTTLRRLRSHWPKWISTG
jgi:hypothetical protein